MKMGISPVGESVFPCWLASSLAGNSEVLSLHIGIVGAT